MIPSLLSRPSPSASIYGQQQDLLASSANHIHDHPLKPGKLPYALRVRGSVLRRISSQLLVVTVLSVAVTCISQLTDRSLSMSSVMITTLGFIVGLALSFRTSSAWTSWREGRIAWEKLTTSARYLSSLVWIHAPTDGSAREMLRKKTAINLISAFAVALRNHLREVRGHDEAHVRDLVAHLGTWSKRRAELEKDEVTRHWRHECRHPLFDPYSKDPSANYTLDEGCLPVEIVFHLSAYIEWLGRERKMHVQAFQQALVQTQVMLEVVSTCERILRTPLPIAYNIAIQQLTWVFMIFLPFQLQQPLGWIAIPATAITGAMLFGFAEIGLEIENPWGDDANDLDVSVIAQTIAAELDILTALPPPSVSSFMEHDLNRPFFPASLAPAPQLVAELQSPTEVVAAAEHKAYRAEVADPLHKRRSQLRGSNPSSLRGPRGLFGKMGSRPASRPASQLPSANATTAGARSGAAGYAGVAGGRMDVGASRLRSQSDSQSSDSADGIGAIDNNDGDERRHKKPVVTAKPLSRQQSPEVHV